MCRLFGFRSAVPSQVHRSLLLETNALQRQSREHPDGWGLAFYVGRQPQIARGVASAWNDRDFENLCELISSETVVAHVRKASVGELTIENTHPFEHGPWVMAHNGTIPDFEIVRPEIEAAVAPAYLAQVDGETDSERLFALFLTELSKRHDPHDPGLSLPDVFDTIERVVFEVAGLCARRGGNPSLNMVVTNGSLMAAFRHGRTLYYSTYKSLCPDREKCPAYAPCCEAPVDIGGRVNHLVLASEIIGGPAVWKELPEDALIGVDAQMRLARRSVRVPCPPAVKVA
jgi:glutamine amidotransferase